MSPAINVFSTELSTAFVDSRYPAALRDPRADLRAVRIGLPPRSRGTPDAPDQAARIGLLTGESGSGKTTVFQGARGMPRVVNQIAHHALSAAALDNTRTVTADHIHKALQDLQPLSNPTPGPRNPAMKPSSSCPNTSATSPRSSRPGTGAESAATTGPAKLPSPHPAPATNGNCTCSANPARRSESIPAPDPQPRPPSIGPATQARRLAPTLPARIIRQNQNNVRNLASALPK